MPQYVLLSDIWPKNPGPRTGLDPNVIWKLMRNSLKIGYFKTFREMYLNYRFFGPGYFEKSPKVEKGPILSVHEIYVKL